MMTRDKQKKHLRPHPKEEPREDPIARPGLEKMKWWIEFVVLPLTILAAAISVTIEGPELWRHWHGEKGTSEQLEDQRRAIDSGNDKVLKSLATHLEFTLGHGSQTGGWSLLDDDTSTIPSTESIQAQVHTDNGTGYVLEVDGSGDVSLLKDKDLQDKYGSLFKVVPPSETLIGLALDSARDPTDALASIQAHVKNVFALQPTLPPGRHIIWRPSGWTWTYQKGLKAPDLGGLAKEAAYKKWADAAQNALNESLPKGTLYYGHTVAVK